MISKKLVIVVSIFSITLLNSCRCYMPWDYCLINKSDHNITIIYSLIPNPSTYGPFVFTTGSKIGDLDPKNPENNLILNQIDIVTVDSTTVTAILKPNQGLIFEYSGDEGDFRTVEKRRSLFSNLKELLVISGSDTIMTCSSQRVPEFFEHRDDDSYVSMIVK